MDLRSSECDVVSLYVLCWSVNGSVCFVCCVFVNCLVKQFAICLVKQFAICLGVFAIWLLNVMNLFSVARGALLDRPYNIWSSKECVCCACDPSERLDAPSICFVCVFVCRKLSPHLGV